jgi:hypothetical protein
MVLSWLVLYFASVRRPARERTTKRLEFMLGVLIAQGASTELGLDDEATLRSAMNAVHDLAAATGRLPHLTGWLARPSGPSPEEQFGLGLGFLLDGIARCLAGAETRPVRTE